jgi:imidazolonepropionase-like amidohydrolase
MAGPSFFDDPRTIEVTQGATPGAAPWMQAITDDTDLPLAVARAAGTSATAIKIYANLPPHLVEAITAEAHRQGLMVWAHGMVFPTTPAEGIEAGVDSVSHVCMLAYQVMKERPSAYAGRAPIEHEKIMSGDTAELTTLFERMRTRRTILDATTWLYRKSDADAEVAAQLTAQAFRAGVLISTGTDGFTPPEDRFPALLQELELLNEKSGMPAVEVIRSATSIGAAAIGQQNTMGTIEAGKLANFVVVAENPLRQISNLRSVVFTVKRGRRFDSADYAHG